MLILKLTGYSWAPHLGKTMASYDQHKVDMEKIRKQNEEWYGPLPPQKPRPDPYKMAYVQYMRGLAPADSKTKKGFRKPFTGLPAYARMLDPTDVDTELSQVYEQEGSCLSRKYLDKQAAKKAIADSKALLKKLGIPVNDVVVPGRRAKLGKSSPWAAKG